MNYTCPYCNYPSTILPPNRELLWQEIDIEYEAMDYGKKVGFVYEAIACPNQECKKLKLEVALTNVTAYGNQGATLQSWQLLPESMAKPQPVYIPAAIINDYTEACRIVKLSPKASATLARRCLQGMIRDFWDVRKGRLIDEIKALKDNPQVSPEAWAAIDAVRSVGNIGAHMENDVNVIVDIEPNEADLLISLIEDLFTDWYVASHERQERYAKIVALAAEKNTAKKKPAVSTPTEASRE